MVKFTLKDYLQKEVNLWEAKLLKHFLEFIQNQFPSLFESFKKLYKTGGADKAYKTELYAMVNGLRAKYGVSSSYTKPIKEKLRTE